MTPTDVPTEKDAEETDAGSAGSPPEVPRDAPARGGAAGWITLAVIAILLAATAFFGFRWWQAEQDAALREEAVAEAREYAVVLGTYDYRSFDDNLAAVTANSTEEFAARYDSVAGDLRGLVENGEGTSTARADHAGLESFDGEVATVLVFLDQDVKNVVVPEGRTDATRFLITLKRIDGRWLLDGADAR
ncbi:Mce-associated membrane protein [Rhodococcus pyridinivorans]|uniref:hypothetical protein n=1 Tax=Rhodococcus TaxID=1827 RepID=UPI0007CD86FC|nr:MULTISPECIES: hypothetical protein [Rhodococcus]MBX4170985.1 hypothetical protein [Rhodococcus sp. DMU2021]SEB63784.1 Mce-associated membrane protein [Rhodococcus pyridinivorans]